MIATLATALVLTAIPEFVVRNDTSIGTFQVKADGTRAGLTRAFGRPETLRSTTNGCRASWLKFGMQVDLYNLGRGDRCKHFHHAVLTGRRWRTSNGLSIGDSLARARRLFPRAEPHGRWLWLIPRRYPVGDFRYPGLSARATAGRVSALRVQYPAGGD